MNHDRHPQALTRFKEWKKPFLRKVESVDVRANLHPKMTSILGRSNSRMAASVSCMGTVHKPA